ncbi:hypothetical protein KY311_04325 [Candidatus Woesearchaeota archaeon]|nr:hypothetical protein [Candidatus Woesearchaeota archaeon]
MKMLLIVLVMIFLIGCTGQAVLEDECNSDNDCVPVPECHPMRCINRQFEGNYDMPEMCTLEYRYEAAYNEEDCICVQKKCTNKNLGRMPEY